MKKSWIILLADLLSFWIGFFIVIFIRFGKENYLDAVNSHLYPFFILSIVWIFIFYILGLYDIFSIKTNTTNIRKFLISISLSFVIGIFLFYLVPVFGISPKINLLLQIVFFGGISFYLRFLIYKKLFSLVTKPIIFIGESLYIKNLLEIIKTNTQLGFSVSGFFSNIEDISSKNIKLKNLFIVSDKIPKLKDEEIIKINRNGIEITNTINAYEKFLQKIPIEIINQEWILDNIKTKMDSLYKIITQITNYVFATIILIISSPFTLISILFIYLTDRGPVFYKQNRVGLNGKIFKIYKLRSMIIDSEKNGAVWSSGSKDPRTTTIGKIIRKTHIDEIPQMINILKGDITLIGPRPERPEFVKELEESIPHYRLRHIVKPGFTGWAQIKYRYARTTDDSKEKFEYDLYYIKNKNIFLYIEIILKTVRIIFTH